MTTKLHAVVDAIGLPLRIKPTPGHYGDCPRASSLLSGLEGVGHVIADAAYDADHLRAFIASNLKATAQIKVNQHVPVPQQSTGGCTRNAIRLNAF
ncbi:transposase DDE domain protein [Brucella melitensis bv. 2 str. 63/9]|nr:transposase DDE domain protein [Brucella melitensis bv. 2 str. 63/9]